jgi:hypothetical protein
VAPAHPGDLKQLGVALHGFDGPQSTVEHDGVQEDAEDLANLFRQGEQGE